jgi:L-aspartate oxidase
MVSRFIVDSNVPKLEPMDSEVTVIGTGIAGLFTALEVANYTEVVLICKRELTASNTNWAQGGIAAAIAEEDSPQLHLADTLMAGAGLNSRKAVNVLVHEGPAVVEDLIRLGTEFDLEEDQLALTKEGAHSRNRILHANGDATGAEIVRALSIQVRNHPRIKIMEFTFAIDLVTDTNGFCRGVLVMTRENKIQFIRSKATVLATGGAGQLYRYTTNPDVATADGIGMAYRAGAVLKDLEFVQFHPTSLCYPGAPRFLISEAVRGEGAVLRNIHGERFMDQYHELQELAPRDIVARAIVSEMEKTSSPHVYLDITHEPADKVKSRFPTIYEFCLEYGLDITTDWIPVAPAAHYMMGGVDTDLNGESSVPGLYACGEVSSTGVHGANRLASNSLSEALVFGKRIANHIRENYLNKVSEPIAMPTIPERYPYTLRRITEEKLQIQKVMVRYVGLKCSKDTLHRALAELGRLTPMLYHGFKKIAEFECINILTTAWLCAQAAMNREESRGGHFRSDFPERNDERWQRHIAFQKDIGAFRKETD